MKKMGRTHRSFFRICAMDKRSPRDGRVLEELGTYDPSIPDTNARAILKRDRIDYWLSVGAQPSGNVSVLIKKYGTTGSHLEVQKAALEKIAQPKVIPDPGKPASMPQSPASEASEEQTEPAPTAEAKSPAEGSTEDSTKAQAPAETTAKKTTTKKTTTKKTTAKKTAAKETTAKETTPEKTVESDSGDPKDTDAAKSS
jgi:small subunit ribosomal protein S16